MATTRKRKAVDAAAALAAVKETDVKQTVTAIGELSMQVQGTLAGLGVTMTGKVEELQQLDTAIDAKKAELKDIHDIDTEAMSLEELTERRFAAQAAFDKEIEQRVAERDEEDIARMKELRRLAAESDYDVTMLEKQRRAALDTVISEMKRAEKFREEDVSRELEERIAAVGMRELHIEALQTQVEAIPELTKKEAEKQVAIATGSLKRNHTHEKELLEQAAAAAATLAGTKIASLEEALTAANTRNEVLGAQLIDANDRTKEIATSAVNNAGQQQTIETLQNAIQSQGTATSGRGR